MCTAAHECELNATSGHPHNIEHISAEVDETDQLVIDALFTLTLSLPGGTELSGVYAYYVVQNCNFGMLRVKRVIISEVS